MHINCLLWRFRYNIAEPSSLPHLSHIMPRRSTQIRMSCQWCQFPDSLGHQNSSTCAQALTLRMSKNGMWKLAAEKSVRPNADTEFRCFALGDPASCISGLDVTLFPYSAIYGMRSCKPLAFKVERSCEQIFTGVILVCVKIEQEQRRYS